MSGERNIYVDLRNIHLHLKLTLLSWNDTSSAFEEVTDATACVANNILHSAFSNVEASLQGVQISSSNNLYGHKAFIETELSHPTECKNTWLVAQGYQYEQEPGVATTPALATRRAKNTAGNWNTFYGRLAIDF